MAKGRPRKATASAPQVRFAEKLILNQWLLSLFGVQKFTELAEHLRDPELEGLGQDGIHRFHHLLKHQFPKRSAELNDLDLLSYDQNIGRHTRQLNEGRLHAGQEPIQWKYYQYLILLFTEIYLDRYFRDPQALLTQLNGQIDRYNAEKATADQLTPFDETGESWPQLNKLAFWSATGSGKTLLMHANILQYQHYLALHRRQHELNRIILLTPNEGLSLQHLKEFQAAGIGAELFDKSRQHTIFAENWIQIIDIHKLRTQMGEKTVAVEAFEGNNLVLVDEGHRGASSGEEGSWMQRRNDLCEKGFSFEYSATFGQAVKADKKRLTDIYARSILFDYSYRYFYEDGFGKEYQILNLDEGTERNYRERYLVACLLAFFQQLKLYRDLGSTFRPFQIEKPLWIFVGGSVAKFSQSEASDIVLILQFLDRYLKDRRRSVGLIRQVLEEGLVTDKGANLFEGRFPYLVNRQAEQLFDETLALLFNAPAGGSLHIQNLKGAAGEIALSAGENPAFGVINVGDDVKLRKICEEQGLSVIESQFAGSLFQEINRPSSTINLLIGAKKFTEGWNSWRVSTMGLMNVGQSEGAQIIQLFGRGVRLKGYNFSLKRSTRAQLPAGLQPPKHLDILETLTIFGIKANYMAQFRDFLEEEGVKTSQRFVELQIPIQLRDWNAPLKTLRLKRTINGVRTDFGDAFRRLGPIPTLEKPKISTEQLTAQLQKNRVVLDWYPKIQALKSRGVGGGDGEAQKNQAHLTEKHIAFFNLERLYFELERYKAERGWYNLNLSRAAMRELLLATNWYELYIPESEMAFTSFENVWLWEEIALALLKAYSERYYKFRKAEWENKHLEYQVLERNDPNFLREEEGEGYYYVKVDEERLDLVTQVQELIEQVAQKRSGLFGSNALPALSFGEHLYEPLLYLNHADIQVKPVALNKGEWQFVQDLFLFCERNKGLFQGKKLYLLRNQSKGKGVGFFEAGNFHPDFMLWLVEDGTQRLTFIDPKGLLNVGEKDPKLQFFETVKEIEARLGDPTVTLDSFILSRTRFDDLELRWQASKAELQARHVLFLEDKEAYVEALLQLITK